MTLPTMQTVSKKYNMEYKKAARNQKKRADRTKAAEKAAEAAKKAAQRKIAEARQHISHEGFKMPPTTEVSHVRPRGLPTPHKRHSQGGGVVVECEGTIPPPPPLPPLSGAPPPPPPPLPSRPSAPATGQRRPRISHQ